MTASVPARVLRPYWCGRHAASNAGLTCAQQSGATHPRLRGPAPGHWTCVRPQHGRLADQHQRAAALRSEGGGCRRVASARQAFARCAYACVVGACPSAAQRRQDPRLECSRRRTSPAFSPPRLTRTSFVGRRLVPASKATRPHRLGRFAGVRCLCAPSSPRQTRVPGPPAANHPVHSGSAGGTAAAAAAALLHSASCQLPSPDSAASPHRCLCFNARCGHRTAARAPIYEPGDHLPGLATPCCPNL